MNILRIISFRKSRYLLNLVPRACDPWEGNEGSGIIRCRKPGILAKIELRIHFNGKSDSSLKRIIPEPSFPSQGSQARGTRLDIYYEMYCNFCFWDARPKNNLLISNFAIFESLLFEGYSCKRLQTLYTC